MVPEHSLQSLLPGLTQPVPQTQNATCWGSCQLQSWTRRWMWVQVWPLTQSSSAGAMLYSHKTSSVAEYEWPLTQCTKYRQTASVVKSAVPLLTNCTLWQAMQICTRVQQLCIRLNSSKIHTSNNNLVTCAAPFIPPHSSQLWIQHAYQLPQPHIQYPLSFEYFTCCTLSTCARAQNPVLDDVTGVAVLRSMT